ncbi:hypothetical protein Y032_0301g1834 [Ancylostoma ceylanicum]|uniref:Uncharacterized protein n=1 Tax=Ancylostoma ceylanicum TaxID=53326 RepID=A0A016S3R3_9BILA|nr:hypothetical protein Y032_0301g1834 [Ancylostoma ceylanicum]
MRGSARYAPSFKPFAWDLLADGTGFAPAIVREKREICKTMCFGSFLFVLILAVAAVITVIAARPYRPPQAQLAHGSAQDSVQFRIPNYDLVAENDEIDVAERFRRR